MINMKEVKQNWRSMLMVAEMTFRLQVTDSFILFTILLQPLIIAVLGLWMLKDKGPDIGMFVIIGSGMTGLWSSLLFISGGNINFERWVGTLELTGCRPHPLRIDRVRQEYCQRGAIVDIHDRRIHRSSLAFWVLPLRSTTSVVRCFPDIDGLRFHQFRADHRTDLCDQSDHRKLYQWARVPDLHPERFPVPDRIASRLDNSPQLPFTSLLGGCRIAWHINRQRTVHPDVVRLGHDAALQSGRCYYCQAVV